MDVKKREFIKSPPREPLTTLAAVVRDFQWRFPRERRDMVWEYCKDASSLREAIQRACDSRAADGKMHNHQSRVTAYARKQLEKNLVDGGIQWMMMLKQGQVNTDDYFDAIHDLVEESKPLSGIGPVTVYDVATRIGAYLDIHPTSLYLHAGVRQGLYALFEATDQWWGGGRSWAQVHRVPRANLVGWYPALDALPTDEIEDFLCTYRDVFADLVNDPIRANRLLGD